MRIDVSRLDPPPAGFGSCPQCPYRANDSAAICFACARQVHQPLYPGPDRCWICDLPLKTDGDCGNPVCGMPKRWFHWNYSVTYREDPIERAINVYKYQEKRAWRLIFGRILVGFLDEESELFEPFDAIIPSPTYVGEGEGARKWDHTAAVLESAAQLTNEWPFRLTDPQLVIKTMPTPPMVGNTYKERRQIAEEPLRAALKVTDAAFVKGKEVLVYDDVFTGGLTLREVARALRVAGAERVCGVTLCRQAYGGG